MVIFFHNTATTYRIPLFRLICEKTDVEFVFTRIELAKKIYASGSEKTELEGIRYKILSSKYTQQLSQIRSLILQIKVTGVVVPTLDSLTELLQAFYIYWIAKKKRKRILFYVEHWDAPDERRTVVQIIKDGIRNIFTKIIIHGADIILINGIKTEQYLNKLNVDKDKVRMVYTVSEISEYSYNNLKDKLHINKNKKIILYFGRIIRRKGLDILLRAYALLEAGIKKEIHLVICGDGAFAEECRALAASLNIENISWIGSIPPEERYEYFSQCDLFVIPSYFYKGKAEVWGLTINEAIQCGKPIIATTAVGAAYELIYEENGIIVEENNISELRNAIESVLSGNVCRAAEVTGQEIFKKYNYENSAEVWRDILTEE